MFSKKTSGFQKVTLQSELPLQLEEAMDALERLPLQGEASRKLQ